MAARRELAILEQAVELMKVILNGTAAGDKVNIDISTSIYAQDAVQCKIEVQKSVSKDRR